MARATAGLVVIMAVWTAGPATRSDAASGPRQRRRSSS